MENDLATVTTLQRKTGEAYLIRYTHPKTNKFIRKIIWCTKEEAEKWAKKIENDIALGIFTVEEDRIKAQTVTWVQLKDKYLKYSSINNSKKTTERATFVFKAFEGFIDHTLPLSKITRELIEEYRNSRLGGGKSNATVFIELKELKTTFNQGIRWEMVKTNPVVGVRYPRLDMIKVRFLKISEVKQLFKVLEDSGNRNFKQLVIAYLNTGARRNELISPQFTWDNVDFIERTISLRGKNDKLRHIPMNDTLYDILDDLKKRKHIPFEYKPDYVTHKLKEYYVKAGIVNANVHSLRKTFGSVLLQNNLADLYTVSKLLGHSSVKTTERYYVDLLDENYRKPVQQLSNIY